MTEPLTKVPRIETESPDEAAALLYRLEEFWDESVPWAQTLREAHEALQGAWYSVTGRREVALLVAGNRFTVHFRDGDIYMGVFDINPAAEPRTMDMHIEEGPARHKGQTALCIYEVESRTLRWCAAEPGRTERLTTFPGDADTKYLNLVLSRDRKA